MILFVLAIEQVVHFLTGFFISFVAILENVVGIGWGLFIQEGGKTVFQVLKNVA